MHRFDWNTIMEMQKIVLDQLGILKLASLFPSLFT